MTLPSDHRVPGPGAPSSSAIPWSVQQRQVPAGGTQLSWQNAAELGLHPLPPDSSPLNSPAVLILERRPAKERHENRADKWLQSQPVIKHDALLSRIKSVTLAQGIDTDSHSSAFTFIPLPHTKAKEVGED